MISEVLCRTQQQANYIVAIKTYTVSGAGSDGCVTGCGAFVRGVGCGLGYNGVATQINIHNYSHMYK